MGVGASSSRSRGNFSRAAVKRANMGLSPRRRALPPMIPSYRFPVKGAGKRPGSRTPPFMPQIDREQAMQSDLRLVVDALPGLVWTALPNGQVDFLNQPWCDYAGMTPEE